MGEDMNERRTVTVCAECLCASCWQAVFFCDDYMHADVVEKTVFELEELGLESPHYWEPEDD